MNKWIEEDEELVVLYPSHPGQLLKEEVLPAVKVSGAALARAIGIKQPNVSDMLNGKAPITPLMAARIEAAIGFSAEMLLRFQMAYDLATIRREQASELAHVERIAA